MRDRATISFRAVLQRKHPKLPVYIVVEQSVVASWSLLGTTVVEGSVNGFATGRRTIKPWDASRQTNWFMEFTSPFCKSAGIAVGDELVVSLMLAATDVPEELQACIAQSRVAENAWNQLSDAKKRATMEHIRGGKSKSTRERRAALVVQQLGGEVE